MVEEERAEEQCAYDRCAGELVFRRVSGCEPAAGGCSGVVLLQASLVDAVRVGSVRSGGGGVHGLSVLHHVQRLCVLREFHHVDAGVVVPVLSCVEWSEQQSVFDSVCCVGSGNCWGCWDDWEEGGRRWCLAWD